LKSSFTTLKNTSSADSQVESLQKSTAEKLKPEDNDILQKLIHEFDLEEYKYKLNK